MIIYIDAIDVRRILTLGVSSFDGEECLTLDTKPYNCRGFNSSKHYMLCKDCLKNFEDFMNGMEVVAP